jgi:hypothetical protein
MTEMITDIQLKKLAKIFRRSGRTFQTLAKETGLTSVPDHVSDLTKDGAKEFLRNCGAYLVAPKEKQ